MMDSELNCSWPTSKRSGWLIGTEIAVVELTALPEIAPVPVMFTVISATVPVKPAAGSTEKVIFCIDLAAMLPT